MKLYILLFILNLFLFLSISYAEEKLITFVCTGNTGRSPMAEALANKIINGKYSNIKVQSRGVNVDINELQVEKGTLIILKERWIDISSHLAIQLTKEDIKNSFLILTMTKNHKDKIISIYPEAKDYVFTLSEYATGKDQDLLDPYKQPIEAYKKLEKQLDQLLPLALEKASDMKGHFIHID